MASFSFPVFHIEAAGIAYGDGALDDHHGVGVHLQHQVNNLFHVRGVEEVLGAIVVGRRSDNHEVGITVTRLAVQCGMEV